MSDSTNPTIDKRIVLVTGANKGIGYEAIKLLSQRIPHGTILLGTRSISNGESAIAQLRESTPNHSFDNVHILQIDVTSEESVNRAVEQVKELYGHLDVLINNSGVAHIEGDIDAKEIFEVNFYGAHRCIEAFAPLIPRPRVSVDTAPTSDQDNYKSGTGPVNNDNHHRPTNKAGGSAIILVSSEVGAWHKSLLPSETRDMLEDIDNVTWEKTVSWAKDWNKFSKGQPRTLSIPPASTSVDDSGTDLDNANGDDNNSLNLIQWAKLDDGTLAFATRSYSVSKALITAWARSFAKRTPEVPFAIVCPAFCKTDMTQGRGFRKATQGGESIVWPMFNDFEQGQFYQDGEVFGFVQDLPGVFLTDTSLGREDQE